MNHEDTGVRVSGLQSDKVPDLLGSDP